MNMKKTFAWVLAALFAAAIVSCGTSKSSDSKAQSVDYKVAQNYFLKNNVEAPVNAVVSSQEEFDSLFGSAAFMGQEGTPTKIDFEKEFVIGVVLPETNHETKIDLGELTVQNDTLFLNYSVVRGEEELSWTMVPVALAVVDKEHLCENCVLKETE